MDKWFRLESLSVPLCAMKLLGQDGIVLMSDKIEKCSYDLYVGKSSGPMKQFHGSVEKHLSISAQWGEGRRNHYCSYYGEIPYLEERYFAATHPPLTLLLPGKVK